MSRIGLIVMLSFFAAAVHAGGKDPCTVATEGDSPVAQACTEGGRGAAKKTMKALVGAAKKAGSEHKCGDCHVNTKSYELKDNARDDFKRLLSAAGTVTSD